VNQLNNRQQHFTKKSFFYLSLFCLFGDAYKGYTGNKKIIDKLFKKVEKINLSKK